MFLFKSLSEDYINHSTPENSFKLNLSRGFVNRGY